MHTNLLPTYDSVNIVVFPVVTHSLYIVQMLASPALHSSPMHLHISCAGLDTVFLWNMSHILLCSLRRSPFVNKSLSTEQLNAKYNCLIIQYTITYDTQLAFRHATRNVIVGNQTVTDKNFSRQCIFHYFQKFTKIRISGICKRNLC